MKKMLLLISPVLVLAACTKKLDYKTEYKDQVVEKSIFTDVPYLYTASQDTSSRTDGGIRPFWKGEDKLVRFRFTDKELQVVSYELDSRYQDNGANKKLLISIPIEQIEYRCAQDRYGQCTNKEEKNAETTMAQRSKFKPDVAAAKFIEANTMPAEMEKIFGGNCYSEQASRVLSANFTPEAINIRIEKTFNVDIKCVKDATSLGNLLSNLTTTAVYHYSFTRLDTVTSKNYQPIQYPKSDSNTFGFFTTDQYKLDVDGNAIIGSKSELLNRWNPERNEVIYYLSNEFNKPANAGIKEATLDAFKRINRGLETAGVKFRIIAKDAEDRVPGDNRYSFIVLVEDPIAASILGYGPTTANPLTGEIISGRVVMYSGVMKQYIRWTYEEIRRRQLDQKSTIQKAQLKPQILQKVVNQKSVPTSKLNRSGLGSQLSVSMPTANINFETVKSQLMSGRMSTDQTASHSDTLKLMSKNCHYPAELFNFDEAAGVALQSKMGKDLKPWMELSDSEKQSVIETVMPHAWIPTLVHEMGHNLGLRHNFKGSEDKENFYTADELKDMKIDRPIPYSSVMDYPYTDLNHLPTLGKYDIAALRFAYQRELLTKSGEVIKLESSIAAADLDRKFVQGDKTKLAAKEYMFCTDEHTDVNIGCKRFDEGTSFTEIAQQQIKSYLTVQENRNYRNGRANMSATEDHLYAERVWGTFANLRLYLTVMSRLKTNFHLGYDHPQYQQDPFLKDLRQATQLSLQFLASVITTPDVNCIMMNKKTGQTDNLPLAKISQTVTSCQELPANPNIAMLGQFGRFLNHVKDEKMQNPYIDQIDIRGIWVDKLLAAKALFARDLGSRANESTDNFFDLPEGQEILPSILAGFVVGGAKTDMDIQLPNGATKSIPVYVDLADGQQVQKTMSSELMKSLGLPDRNFYVAEWILNYAKKALQSSAELNQNSEALADSFTVTKLNSALALNIDQEKTKSIAVSDQTYLASAENNIIAALAIDQLLLTQLLNNPELRKEQVENLIKSKMANIAVDPTGLNAAEQAFAQIPKDKLLLILQGKVPSDGYLIRLLNVMAK